MSKDKRLYSIISDLASNNKASAISTFKAVCEDRVTDKVKQFTLEQRIKIS